MPNPKLETYKNKATSTVYDLTDANAQASLTAILDGTSIDSFADVESAFAGNKDTLRDAEVIDGKNLLNEVHLGNINSAGAYDSSSTNRCTNATSATSSKIYLKKGSYVISATGLDSATVLTKNSSGTIVDNYANAWHDLPYTFEVTSDAYFYFTGRKSDNSDITLSSISVMLCTLDEWNADPSYEPYYIPLKDSIQQLTDAVNLLPVEVFSGTTMKDIYNAAKTKKSDGFKVFAFANTTGLPTITTGFAIMIWHHSFSSSYCQIIGAYQGNIESAYISGT